MAEIATHAHDIYLQVAYDHGIPVGVVFVLVGAATLVVSLIYYGKQKKTITYAALPAVITVAVAVAGIVEWISSVQSLWISADAGHHAPFLHGKAGCQITGSEGAIAKTI
ncbi:MAG: hypothetical protein V8S42_05915 [Lachnospiraceae bacterium]